jgi:photosystem II stability/assembly factor-like uncharacterized protein
VTRPLVVALACALTATSSAWSAGAPEPEKKTTPPKGATASKAPAPASKAKDKAKDDAGETKSPLSADGLAGLELRGIGPALTSGRIGDIAVDPQDKKRWFIAVASGGVWKTTNAGTTFTPVFDGEGSFSIGCVTIDPKNPHVVWVGTGENNSQRSVAYGDGVYKSEDGGKSWQNMGLRTSEHIAKILIDPRDSNVVYVAAQGPLWNAGGERGLYKTTDGGKTWKAVLTIGEHTGVTDVVMDPRDPDVLYAAAYQRRRAVWTLINGGPEGGLHKSTDGGATWRKLSSGLPKEDIGRIGLAIPVTEPDWVYAVVEAANKTGGFFRSTDRGMTWEKRSSYVPGGPQYYNEIFADPKDPLRVYSIDVFMQVTDDGGKTFRRLGESSKHVDNHVIWIDPDDTNHYLVGCDGGIYESWDRAQTWDYKANLSVTQFYRVAIDNARPFYNVYGGTQDNFSLGGPARTRSSNGIANQDWVITWGGDGFESQIDPTDPNIVYAQAQHGALGRVDRRSGEGTGIQPQAAPGDEPLRWNWDSPLIISPHAPTRLYFAAQRVFRSDDRGQSWKPISADLSRRIDRNKLPLMGRVWGIDAVAKNASTSLYGNIVGLSESPKVEGLLYASTDDGLVQVSEDGGTTWRKTESFPGVPANTPVVRVEASQHDADGVFAVFDNHRAGDFKPYLMKSRDRGRTWTSIAGDLPARGTVYSMAEDHVRPELLFAGTEFGLFVTLDGGTRWIQLKGGLPTIQVRDLAIQKREDDLVLATFGRGFYVFDDYSPLRGLTAATLEQAATLFPVKPAAMYVQETPLGLPGKGFLGDAFFTAPNPPFGAIFTYHLKDELKTRKTRRQEAEKEAIKKAQPVGYPTPEELRAEAAEEAPTVLLTVTDAAGRVVRRLEGPVTAGFHRIAWDLRLPPATPVSLEERAPELFSPAPTGALAAPGRYSVALSQRVDGQVTALSNAQSFEAVPLGLASLPAAQRDEVALFQGKVARLQRAVLGAQEAAGEADTRLRHVKKAIDATPAAAATLGVEVRALEARLRELRRMLEGDKVMAARNEAVPPSIGDRVDAIVSDQWASSSAPTQTSRDAYRWAAQALVPVLDGLRKLVEQDLGALERQLEAAGAPWTPGRLPSFTPEP